MSSRERIALLQGELMRALVAAGPVPAGFDGAGVAEEARTLAGKRRRQAARSRQALVRALGRRFAETFAAYAGATPYPGTPCSDGAAFARWFDARLGDEELIERLNWQVGLRAVLAAAERRPGDPAPSAEERADLEQFHALLDGVARRRGPLAVEEPRLKAALVIGSLGAFGVVLERRQVEALRRDLVAALAPGGAPSCLLDAALATLRANLAIERVLARHLRPDQRALHLSRTSDDPFHGRDVPRVALRGSRAEIARQLVSHWSERFALDAGSSEALRPVAAAFAERAALVPEVPGDPALRREALLDRAEELLALQRAAEEELALLPSLTDLERARVGEALGSVLLDEVVVGPPAIAAPRVGTGGVRDGIL